MQNLPRESNFVFLATAPNGVLTAGLRGLLKGVAHLWKNKGVAPLRELLYSTPTIMSQVLVKMPLEFLVEGYGVLVEGRTIQDFPL